MECVTSGVWGIAVYLWVMEECGVWGMEYRSIGVRKVCSTRYGVWGMEYGGGMRHELKSTYAERSMENLVGYGVWITEYGMGYKALGMRCGVWGIGCGV